MYSYCTHEIVATTLIPVFYLRTHAICTQSAHILCHKYASLLYCIQFARNMYANRVLLNNKKRGYFRPLYNPDINFK